VGLVFLSKSAQAIENKGRRMQKGPQESSRVRKLLRNRGLRRAAWKLGEKFDGNDMEGGRKECRTVFVAVVEDEVREGCWAAIMAEDTDLVI